MNALEIKMNEKERLEISSFIESEFGIKMPAAKKILLTSRLSKRLAAHGFRSYSEYYSYIKSSRGMEEEFFIFADLVSTHETSFFREAQHFEYLYSDVLPNLAESSGAGARRPLRVLSAACSTGEEAYTIAITIEEFKRNKNYGAYLYRITGTDISTKVVSSAARAVYSESRIGKIPHEYKRRYFMRGRNGKSELVRIVPEMRAATEFFSMNLMNSSYPFSDKFDIIFCRNALIYFDKSNQEKIIKRLTGHLSKNGFLFIGHSETLSAYDLPLKCLEPTIFRRV